MSAVVRIFKNIVQFVFYAVAAVAAFVFLANLFIYLYARPHIYGSLKDLPKAQVVIIPGAAAPAGRLSTVFEDRVKAALALYGEGKVDKILVSGDNSTRYYNEVSPVRKYLLDAGVPEGDIVLDHAGFDTYSTMYRAKEIFQAESAIVATQTFHLPRAIFIGRMLGLETHGLGAQRARLSVRNYVREVFANEKALLDLLLSRQPKYLGEPEPVGGK